MKIDVLQKKNNELLSRDEIIISINNDFCPKKEDILKDLNLKHDNSVIKKVSSSFGKKEFLAEVFVYKTKEDKERFEKIPRKVRKKILEEKKQKEIGDK